MICYLFVCGRLFLPRVCVVVRGAGSLLPPEFWGPSVSLSSQCLSQLGHPAGLEWTLSIQPNNPLQLFRTGYSSHVRRMNRISKSRPVSPILFSPSSCLPFLSPAVCLHVHVSGFQYGYALCTQRFNFRVVCAPLKTPLMK